MVYIVDEVLVIKVYMVDEVDIVDDPADDRLRMS